jgi:Holliday junction resolvasome RuvABC endonuclease subunit
MPFDDGIADNILFNDDQHFSHTLANNYSRAILVGIDLSLTCPGLCIIDVASKCIKLLYCRQRSYETDYSATIQDQKARFHGWQVSYLSKPAIPIQSKCEKDNRFIRFSFVCNFLMTEIEKVIVLNNESSSLHFAIESYSYASQQTPSTSILYELGGIVRYAMFSKWQIQFNELSPCHIKKVFTRNGHAEKRCMISRYIQLLGIPKDVLYQKLGMIKRSGQVRKDLHPLEDLVDAFAICYTNVMDKYPVPKAESKSNRQRRHKRKLPGTQDKINIKKCKV